MKLKLVKGCAIFGVRVERKAWKLPRPGKRRFMAQNVKMSSYLLLSLLLFKSIVAYKLFDLPNVKTILSPESGFCEGRADEQFYLALVHSAPNNAKFRQTIRETWAKVSGWRVAFILAAVQDPKRQNDLEEEAEMEGDLIQADFIDAYRNMTYKHLFGYKWAAEKCPNARFILKTDDDQGVDTFHLKLYLEEYFMKLNSDRGLIGCNVLTDYKVQRDPNNKWFVSESEFVEDVYPDYCAGWAYLINLKAIEEIIKVADKDFIEYFWIDDVFMTGILRPDSVTVLDIKNAFLSTHSHMTEQVIRGREFSPEVLFAGDLTTSEMRSLHKKFEECHRKKWAESSIYADDKMREFLGPKPHKAQRDEL